nr:MAG TPA: hypothetical protein [Caudoviricetes sp.]
MSAVSFCVKPILSLTSFKFMPFSFIICLFMTYLS